MDIPLLIDGLDRAVLPAQALHLAIGMFDGVHLGHRAVIAPAISSARREGGISGVLTFWPHPSAIFRPENPTRLMQDPPTKARLLFELGVDAVISQAFTTELAAVAAEEFLPWLKRKLPNLAAVYVGENFRFGHARRGDAALLQATGPAIGVRVFSASRVNVNGAPISSTRIRAQLQAGDVEGANALLGYNYFAEGVVVAGKQLGRTIGFPTLNIPWVPELRPKLGVYTVRVSGAKAAGKLPAVANYGLRPTVENSEQPRLEVHILGDSPFGPGDTIKIEWLRFQRPEMKFAGVEELRAQIGRDRAAAEAFFAP